MNTSVLAFACLDHLCFPGPLSLDSKRLTTPPRKWVFSNRLKKQIIRTRSPQGRIGSDDIGLNSLVTLDAALSFSRGEAQCSGVEAKSRTIE